MRASGKRLNIRAFGSPDRLSRPVAIIAMLEGVRLDKGASAKGTSEHLPLLMRQSNIAYIFERDICIRQTQSQLKRAPLLNCHWSKPFCRLVPRTRFSKERNTFTVLLVNLREERMRGHTFIYVAT